MNPSHRKDVNYFEQAYQKILEKQMKTQSTTSTAIDASSKAKEAEEEAKRSGGKVNPDVKNLAKVSRNYIKKKTDEITTAASNLNKLK